MLRVNDATAPTDTDRMNGHLMDSVVDAHHAIGDRRSHRLADQPPRHRVGVAIDLNGTVGLHTPDQFARGLEGRPTADRPQCLRLTVPKPLNRWLASGAMLAQIGDLPCPSLKMRFKSFPARESAASNRIPFYVANAVLGLALGPGSIWRAGARPEAPVLGKRGQLVVEHDRARRGIVLHDQGARIIQQHFFGHAAELHEGAFQAIEPALLPFVAECSDMVPARVAQRGDEQVGANLAAADLDQPFAKIDLQLFAGRRLEPHRGARFRRKLLAIALHRTFDCAQADDDAFLGCQLLADHVGIAVVLPQTLLEPALLAIERLFALRLSIGRPAAGRDIVLHRVAANPELSGNPFATPPQLVEPEYRRNLVRLQHGLPPRILEPQST